MSYEPLNRKNVLARIEREFTITPARLSAIADHFVDELRKGLENHGATVPMIPTYVTNTVTGNEQGEYMALDIGGTNLRVCRIVLQGSGQFSVDQETFVIPMSLKLSLITDLFDWVVLCVETFFERKGHPLPKSDDASGTSANTIYVGLTFSFSVNQTSLNRGTLQSWSKGFDCPGLLGTNADIVEVLQEAFHRRRHRIIVTALVNDTAGTLLACSYQEPSCKIGVILGTGTNAAYYETREALTKWGTLAHEDPNLPFTEMIINTEWAEFDNERVILPITQYDLHLDAETNSPGDSIFEKLISGMYLGEIVRLVLADLHSQGIIFGEFSLEDADITRRAILQPYSFNGETMSLIVADTTPDHTVVAQTLADFLSVPTAIISADDLVTVQAICSLVGTRAARLSAVGVAAIFRRRPELLEKDQGSTVAVDGSLFENYPGWVETMKETLKDLLGEKAGSIRFRLVKDGSGVGGAIVAMLAAQQQQLQ